MRFQIFDKEIEFDFWEPKKSAAFKDIFAFHCETAIIDPKRPWIANPYVLGVAFDGQKGFFVSRKHLAAFFEAYAHCRIIFLHAPLDLDVISHSAPQSKLYDAVDENRVWDTQLLHRLLVLGLEGHTAEGKGESTLETCAAKYLGMQLAKAIKDRDGDYIRLSYNKWFGRPSPEIDPLYLESLAIDTVATYKLYWTLKKRIKQLICESTNVWGFVSDDWMKGCISKFGLLTHHIQLKGAIALRAVTACGLHVDRDRIDQLSATLTTKKAELAEKIRSYGIFIEGTSQQKTLQDYFKRLDREHRELQFPRTVPGMYSTDRESLTELADKIPFIGLLLEYQEVKSLLSSFVGKANKSSFHPSFNPLVRTGRTSSYGEINAQSLPRDDKVRSCFVPSQGNVFIDADYSTIELAALAQACESQFGLESKMAEAINAGQDLHKLVASRVLKKPEAKVTPAERQKAKAINFGKPGGMGLDSLQAYAKSTYKIEMYESEAKRFSDSWMELFPEMADFLKDRVELPICLARIAGLTWASHAEATGDKRFLWPRENVEELYEPNPILGAMCIRILGNDEPKTKKGKPYSEADIDYFWSRIETLSHRLDRNFQEQIAQRRPSPKLQQAVGKLAGEASVFTYSGRLRAKASYTARRNTIFQGLAADGAKLAMWKLWRKGYRIVNFIHDQFLIEVPKDSDLGRHAKTIKDLMIAGMKEVVPDVKISVEYAASDRWYKNAKEVRVDGNLQIWKPNDEAVAASKQPKVAVPSKQVGSAQLLSKKKKPEKVLSGRQATLDEVRAVVSSRFAAERG